MSSTVSLPSYSEELLSLHRGQGLELYWRDTLQCPTEEEYLSMRKHTVTPHLGFDRDYVPLVNLIGIYFQIRDDLMNLCGTEYAHNKGFAEDLTEGKFSFPIIHSIHADPTNRQVLNVLQKRSEAGDMKKHVIQYMRTKTKSFEYTESVLNGITNQMREEIERLGGNTGLTSIIEALNTTVSSAMRDL
ncbi:hypothetical protein C0993_002312 [Termitomyces sp. T159_Od127]|nr:hypothetical protein C0993_002312 [Termitomyces sp. T159_Od127]